MSQHDRRIPQPNLHPMHPQQLTLRKLSGLCSTTCCHLADLGDQKATCPENLEVAISSGLCAWHVDICEVSNPIRFFENFTNVDSEVTRNTWSAPATLAPALWGTTILRTAWPANFVQLSAVRLESIRVFQFVTCQC